MGLSPNRNETTHSTAMPNRHLALGIGFGIAIGSLAGIIFSAPAIGIGFGLFLGSVAGITMGRIASKHDNS